MECPICKLHKKSVGPKVVESITRHDPKFVNQQLSLITVVMCNDCLNDYKEGKIDIKLKNK